MNAALVSSDSNAIVAVLRREFRAAFVNRYFQVFAAISLAGGIAAAVFTEDANAVPFFVLQMALYLVSLFALLAGVSSAQTERDEWPLMFAQPIARGVFPLAKFLAGVVLFALGSLLLFLPATIAGSNPGVIALLFAHTLLLAATFFAIGLTTGFVVHDRTTALMTAVAAWVVLVFVVDTAGLLAARFALVQKQPDIWVALLMLDPLDAFRIHALFALEQIPPEAANKASLANWWISHAGMWFVTIACIWCAALLTLAVRHLNRRQE
jgi:ABC-type transport system involved in multi-copper enzyme maturation permease subunit